MFLFRPLKGVVLATGNKGTTFSATTFCILQQYLNTSVPDMQSKGIILGISSSCGYVVPMGARMQRIMEKCAEKRAALAGALENMAVKKGGEVTDL